MTDNTYAVILAVPYVLSVLASQGKAPVPSNSVRPTAQRKQKAIGSMGEPNLPSRAPRKERDPNWTRMEMIALVRAKRQEFLDEVDADDPRTLMTTEGTRWKKIGISVNLVDGVICYRSPDACKYKWQQLLPDYKRIADLHRETGTNSEIYFSMTGVERRAQNLPSNFDIFVYREMDEWMRQKPTMTPPHFRDLLHPDDSILPPPSRNHLTNHEEMSGDETTPHESAMHAYNSATAYDLANDSDDVNAMHPNPDVTTSIRFPLGSRPTPSGGRMEGNVETEHRGGAIHPNAHPHGSPAITSPILDRGPSHIDISQLRLGRKMGGHVPGMEGHASDPVIVLSSDASTVRPRKPTAGSTGVRRKKMPGIQSLAEATLQGSERLVTSLKEINDNSNSLQERLLEMELKIHEENMKYKHEKDLRGQEVARLSLIYQNTMASAMVTLAESLKSNNNVQPPFSTTKDTEQLRSTSAGPSSE